MNGRELLQLGPAIVGISVNCWAHGAKLEVNTVFGPTRIEKAFNERGQAKLLPTTTIPKARQKDEFRLMMR